MAARRNQAEDWQRDYRAAQSALRAFMRLDRRARLMLLIVVLLVGAVALAVYLRSDHFGLLNHPTAAGPAQSALDNLLLGNPSHATTDPSNPNNYLMVKPYYALSYNNQAGIPNWVSWRVTAADLGDAPRKQTFDDDSTLPPGFNVVTTRDYTGSGFDRGHMCPHSDRAANEQMSFATFIMTNIIPQAPNVNRKAWAQLEVYCRELVEHQNHLYIIAGPQGRGGSGSKGARQTLGQHHVLVPATCWKIVVVVPQAGDGDDLARITSVTRVIAVIMPNDDSVGEQWASFRTSPAEIERQTGFQFFDRLAPEVAQALRQKVDDTYIRPPRPLFHDRATQGHE